jgi:hypothetical protein
MDLPLDTATISTIATIAAAVSALMATLALLFTAHATIKQTKTEEANAVLSLGAEIERLSDKLLLVGDDEKKWAAAAESWLNYHESLAALYRRRAFGSLSKSMVEPILIRACADIASSDDLSDQMHTSTSDHTAFEHLRFFARTHDQIISTQMPEDRDLSCFGLATTPSPHQ